MATAEAAESAADESTAEVEETAEEAAEVTSGVVVTGATDAVVGAASIDELAGAESEETGAEDSLTTSALLVGVVAVEELAGAVSEATGMRGSVTASVLLVGSYADTCTVVVVVVPCWVDSADEVPAGGSSEELLWWCPGRGLHRDASDMAARLPKRAAVTKNCILKVS